MQLAKKSTRLIIVCLITCSFIGLVYPHLSYASNIVEKTETNGISKLNSSHLPELDSKFSELFKSCRMDLVKNQTNANLLIGLYTINGLVSTKDLNILDNDEASNITIQIFSDYPSSNVTKTYSPSMMGELIVSGQQNKLKKANFMINETKAECKVLISPILPFLTSNGTSTAKEDDGSVQLKSLNLKQESPGKLYRLTVEPIFASCSTKSNRSNSDQTAISKYIIKGTIAPLHSSKLYDQHTFSIVIISDSSSTNENVVGDTMNKNNVHFSSYIVIDPATRDHRTIIFNINSIETQCYNL